MKWRFDGLDLRLLMPPHRREWWRLEWWRPRFVRDLTQSDYRHLFVFQWLLSAGPFYASVSWEEVPEWR